MFLVFHFRLHEKIFFFLSKKAKRKEKEKKEKKIPKLEIERIGSLVFPKQPEGSKPFPLC
jgi:hypothetical protein